MISAMATFASVQGLAAKVAPCTSSLHSSFRGTKLCVKVPASGALQPAGQQVVLAMSGNEKGNGTGKSGASGEPRLGSNGCPLYTTLAGIPVSDDNNRY